MAGAPNVEIIGSNGRGIAVDAVTNSIQTVDYAHHELHAGSHFFVQGYTSTGSGDVLTFGVTVPDTATWPHMRWDIRASGSTTFQYKESAAISGGTPVVAVNSNRNSTNTSTLTLVSGPTITNTGTQLGALIFGVAGANPGSQGAGGGAGREDELILKQNTTYIFQIISNTATNNISYTAFWYEHANKTS